MGRRAWLMSHPRLMPMAHTHGLVHAPVTPSRSGARCRPVAPPHVRPPLLLRRGIRGLRRTQARVADHQERKFFFRSESLRRSAVVREDQQEFFRRLEGLGGGGVLPQRGRAGGGGGDGTRGADTRICAARTTQTKAPGRRTRRPLGHRPPSSTSINRDFPGLRASVANICGG